VQLNDKNHARRELDIINSQIQTLKERRNCLLSIINEECTHSKFENRKETVEGDYYNRGYTRYWKHCIDCGHEFHEQYITGSYG
jgi:uncharacterized coiled-coil DUF342 family protein